MVKQKMDSRHNKSIPWREIVRLAHQQERSAGEVESAVGETKEQISAPIPGFTKMVNKQD